MKRKNILWTSVYGAALTLFTGYVMLDTFLIPTVSVSDASALNNDLFEDEVTISLTDDEADEISVPEETTAAQQTEQSNTENKKDHSKNKTSSDGEKRVRPESGSPKRPENSGSKKGTDQNNASDSASDGGNAENKENKKDAASTSAAPETAASSEVKIKEETKKTTSEKTENVTVTEAQSASDTTYPAETETTVSADSDYADSNIIIKMNEYYVNNTKVYVADVRLSSAKYLKTALANDSYGKNITQTTSDMAEAKNAILAINGDYYGAKESGYVIRNGVLYRDYGSSDTDVLCIYADGHFEITNSSEKTAQQLIDEKVWQAFSFGPALVENSKVSVTEKDEVGRAKASNPRTAIGIIDDLHYIFVVSDGRTSESEGLSLKQLADFMQSLGAKTAYNLDGGGSSTMVFDGELINNPTTSGRNISERKVSDIVYIGY